MAFGSVSGNDSDDLDGAGRAPGENSSASTKQGNDSEEARSQQYSAARLRQRRETVLRSGEVTRTSTVRVRV